MAETDPKEEAFHHKGDRLGKFLILSELGRGSMGVVYKAFQEGINREVALKILPANITLDEKAVKRFHREAESVGRLSHNNIIQVYDNGTIDGTHYFAMEMVDGEDLSNVRCKDREDILHATTLARDSALALAHAHAEGVIHRDIKPSNIMLDKSGRVVVTDFGLARIKDSASLTSTDAVVGTPKYMSPEQVLPGSNPIDGRADVYSLGATLYQCITGRPPLEAPSISAFFKAIIEDRPASPRKYNKQCPHDLATIVLRCLEKNPNDRYATAQAMADDLDRFLKGERIKARPKGAVALGLESVRRHKVITGLSALAAIALLATVFLSGQVKKLREQTGDRDLFEHLDTIRAEADLGLAANAAYELAEEYPDNPRVISLLKHIHAKLADAALNEIEPNWELVANYMARAGKTTELWYLMALMEAGRHAEAQKTAEQLDPDLQPAFLTMARLDLLNGKPAEALARLTGRGGKLHPYSLLVTAQARNTLAGKEGDVAKARRHLEQARELLLQARADIRVRWLRGQIQYALVSIRQNLGETVSFRDSVDDFAVIANRWWGALAGVWEGMTVKQESALKVYVARVLELGGMPPKTIAPEIEAKAKERLKADDPRQKLIANLMLGVARLTTRDFDGARGAFDESENHIAEAGDPLEPYVYWGKSFVQRARGDLRGAVLNAVTALVSAVIEQGSFKDMETLARHTTLLAEDAHEQRKGNDELLASNALKRELGKLKSPGAWVSEILERIARLASASGD